jgi:hypothetical protein
MLKQVVAAVLMAAASLVIPSTARAQAEAGQALRDILYEPEAGTGAFTPNSKLALYNLILHETTTFPIGSAAGGFTWTYDAALNAPRRRSQSFGPMFAERPFTAGLGRLNLGLSFQHTDFKSVSGQPLTDLSYLVSYNFGQYFYRTGASVAVAIDRTIVSASYGVADRVDVGVIVPIGRARVTGSRLYEQLDPIYGRSSSAENISGSSWGVGDVVVRAKTSLFSAGGVDGAADVDLRLPTGDTEKLMGTGKLQAKAMFIAASTIGRVTPHINAGYTFGGSGLTFGPDILYQETISEPELLTAEPSQEINYTVGVDAAVNRVITVAGDVIGRALRNSAKITFIDHGTTSPDRLTYFHAEPATLNLLLGAVGFKANVAGMWLLTGTVLFPLIDSGIKPGVTPVIGFERAF